VKDLSVLKEGSHKTILQFIRFHKFLIFYMSMRVRRGFSLGRHLPKNEVQAYSASNLTTSTDDLIFTIPENNNTPNFRIGRDSHIEKNHHLSIRHLHFRVLSLTDISFETDNPIPVKNFLKDDIPQVFNTSDIFNLTEREGMLSSRCILNMKRLLIRKNDPLKISTTKSKFRKRLGSLSIVSWNGNDKEVLEHQSYSGKRTEFYKDIVLCVYLNYCVFALQTFILSHT